MSHPRPPASPLTVPLTRAYAEVAQRWPGVKVHSADFASRIDAVLRSGRVQLEELALADLLLGTACLAQDPGALAVLEGELFPQLVPPLRQLHPSPAFVDEVLQAVRERVLVGTREGPPRLSSYEGQGPLVKWLRTVALRIAFSLLPAERDDVRLGESLAEVIRASGADPELNALSGELKEELEGALKAAVLALTSEERLLLRMHLVDGLSIDKLDRILGAHRSTVARKINAARESLLSHTRRELSSRLQMLVSRAELGRVAALVQSQLEVSLGRLLGEP